MTTREAEARYEANHVAQWNGRPMAVFNPHNKPVDSLPVIYGFNNGGNSGFMIAQLIAEDGTPMGSHGCSSEAYMPHDLGCLEGTRADRHEGFRAKYPDGYRMEFVGSDCFEQHTGINAAIEKYKQTSLDEHSNDIGKDAG